MNMMEIHGLLVGIPLGLVAVLSAMIFGRKGNHPATYKLSDRWTHDPILWAATDEVVGGAHHGQGSDEVSIGGGASGKW